MELVSTFIPFIILIVIMYFMMIRPQKKQAEQKQNMLSNLKQGDAVVTIGGLHGLVEEVSTNNSTVVLDCEGVYLTFALNAIASVTPGIAPTTTEVVEETTTIEGE